MSSHILKLSKSTSMRTLKPLSARSISFTSSLSNSKKENTSSPNESQVNPSKSQSPNTQQHPGRDGKTKSVTQSDQELREKMEQMSGGGGASGIEYEDGKPNTMKRSVRNNMFRLI